MSINKEILKSKIKQLIEAYRENILADTQNFEVLTKNFDNVLIVGNIPIWLL